jgi:hypothetical protein
MGRTSQPLTIAVWGPWIPRPEIQDLIAKGHTIIEATEYLANLDTVDCILHPRAHRWEDAYWKMLPVVLTQARRRKKAAKA